MVALDALVVTTALSTIRARPRRLGRAARVDGQRLQPQLRGAADDRRGARRPLRAAAPVRRRARRCSRGVGGLRARAQRRLADRRARGAGRRRGAGHAARAGAAERRVPARAARLGASGIFSGDHRPRRARRAGDRRRDHPGHRAGSGSSGSTCRSGWSRSRSCCARIAESFGPRPALDLPGWCWSPSPRSASSGGSCAATPPAGAAPRWSAARGRRRAARGVRRLGAARARADAADAAVPLARVLGGQRGELPDVRGAVRRGVLPGAVPADRARATARSAPACGCCRGPRRCSSSRRSPARSSTASASGR